MFCSYCGNKIDDDSLFCPNCGKSLNLRDNTNSKTPNSEFRVEQPAVNINFKKHFKFITNAIRYPLTTMKDTNTVIPLKISSIYLVLTLILLPLINVLSLKVFASKLMNTFFNLSSLDSGYINPSEKDYLINRFSNYVSYDKIYTLNFIYYLSFYLIIALIILIIYKASKINFDTDYFFKVLVVTALINLTFSIVAFIFSPISIILTAIINLTCIITILILLFYGFKNCCKDTNIFAYGFALAVSISFIITTYFCVRYAVKGLFYSLISM